MRHNKSTQLRLSILLAFLITPPFAALAQDASRGETVGAPLQGHVPDAVARLQPVGRLPGSQRLRLAFGLPLRNQNELGELLRQLYDPASPNYRQFLTPVEFTERFGPSQEDYDAVIAYAKANGFTVTTHPNRVVLDVEGAVSNIERALHVTLRVYQHPTEGRTFYAPDVEPSLDAPVRVLDVSGLDNYSLPRPMSHKRPGRPVTPQVGTGPSGSYRGNDFRSSYVPGTPLTGSNQNVGLLEFDGYYASDIASYVSLSGISTGVILTNVAVDGGVASPGSGNDEVALDIEMVVSMSPGVSKIFVYEAPNATGLWVDMLNQMANDNAAKQLSCSWGGGSPPATPDQIFQQMASQGQSFFNASGDSDAFTGAIPFPSDNTNIVQVGGTTLTTTTGVTYVSEKVWNWGRIQGKFVGSSGGVSPSVPIPSYQKGINMTANLGSTNFHNVPDVALTADNVWVAYNNGSSSPNFGGTSCAAPLWAAFTALINQQAAAHGSTNGVGFLNPAFYAIGKSASYSNYFHDTITGNNFSSSSPTKYPAVPGYDLCTGWGTPNGTNLINTLAPVTAPVNFQLSISKTGAGTGTITSSPAGISCGGTCAASFANNSLVTLTATAGPNSAFRGWIGGCAGTGTCVVTLTSNTTRTANFDALPLISAASIAPGSPTTTNDLVASVTSSNDADGDPITVAYQWQQSIDGSNFSNIAFTTDPLPASATIAGDYYRVLLTPNDGVANGQAFTTATVLVPVDADGNGINDDWEMQYFGQIGIDPNADPDGDGFSNLQEFLAGTDPTDANSALRITSIVTNGPDIGISFTTCSNKFYDAQYNDDLTTSNWGGVATNIPGTGAIVSTNDPGAASLTNRFYRIRLEP